MYVTDLQGNQELITGFVTDSVTINRKINGDYTLSFTVIPTDKNTHSYPLLVDDAVVTVDSQNFIIKIVDDNAYSKRITAVHEFYETIDDMVDAALLDGIYTIQHALAHAFSGTSDWNFIVDDAFAQTTLKDFGNDNAIALLQRIMVAYNAEYDISSVNKRVTVKRRIGVETDYQIRYKHNLQAISRSTDASNVKTAIRVYYNPDNSGDYLSNVVVESPNKNAYRRTKWAKSVYFDSNSQFDAITYGRSFLNDVPSIAVACELVELKEAGYNADDIALGNSFYLIDERLNENDLARVVELSIYPYSDKSPQLVFANRIKDMSDIVVNQKIEQDILDRESVKQKKLYNGVTITPEDGVKVTADNNVTVWLNATEGIRIVNGNVQKFYVDTNGNVVFDGRLKITNGDGQTVMLEAYLDAFGGRLIINDRDGQLNVKLGSEEINSNQRGGILKLFDDGEFRLRASVGADSAYGGNGAMQLYDSSNRQRVALAAIGDSYFGGILAISDSNGTTQSALTMYEGRIGGKMIATQDWTIGYVNSQNYATESYVQAYVNSYLLSLESETP